MKKTLILGSIFALFSFAGLAGAQINTQTTAQSYAFNNDLRVGSSGQDVINLQTWLIASGYDIPAISSSMSAKGYFGLQTKAAVAEYQRSIGLPAYGFFGPLTRQYLKDHGDQGGGIGIGDSASIHVTSPNGGETWVKGTTQYIRWTGSPSALNQSAEIKLEFFTPACAQPGNRPQCMIAVRAPVAITNQVDLNSGFYAWDVGQVLSSTPIPDGQYKIQICPINVANNADSNSCDDSDNYFNISSNPVTTANAPIINGIDAPTALLVGQTGTWSIRATDPLNGTLSYSVDWGDSSVFTPGMVSSVAAPSITQSTSFTHLYVNPGTYTITFTAVNSTGQQARTTTTVVVTNPNTPTGTLKVTSPNGGEVWIKGTNDNIIWTGSLYPVGALVDIKLLPYQAPCTTAVCPKYILAPYIIATGISINQDSYNWNVGTIVSACTGGIACAPASLASIGQYTVQICKSDGSECDSSDVPFTISQ